MVAQMTGTAPSRHVEFKRLLREACAELGVRKNDDRARRLAVIRLQRTALRQVQERDLLAGRLSDPSRLLDADDRLRLEEERLAPATGDHAVTVQIVSSRLCPKCKGELSAEQPPTGVVALPVPLPDVSAAAGVSERGQRGNANRRRSCCEGDDRQTEAVERRRFGSQPEP
jgi:hypothetical protein